MRMNMNQKRRQVIRIAMSAADINKIRLAKALDLSYPTMLKKLKSPDKFKIGQAERLCDLLNIDLREFVNPLNN